MINCRKISCGRHMFYRMALGLGDPADLGEDLEVLIDFRSPADAVRASTRAARCVNLPMTGVGETYRNTKMPTAEDLLAFYRELVDAYRDGYAELARIASTGALIGYGCYFGKDRTGIASYLLGRLFGTPLGSIVEDYCLSGIELRRNIASLPDHWTKRGLTREQYLDRLDCRPETIHGLHRYIHASYGSVRDYLRC